MLHLELETTNPLKVGLELFISGVKSRALLIFPTKFVSPNKTKTFVL
jgi:hypothetical protein